MGDDDNQKYCSKKSNNLDVQHIFWWVDDPSEHTASKSKKTWLDTIYFESDSMIVDNNR